MSDVSQFVQYYKFFEIIKTGKQTSLTSIINGNSQIVS